MKGKKIKQINNLSIYYTEMYHYAVWTPDGICLDDRMTLEQAEGFCKEVTDYTAKKQAERRVLRVSPAPEKKSTFLESKEIYAGYYRTETNPANAVFSFETAKVCDTIGKELVTELPYFVSYNNSTYYFSEDMMDTEFVLKDNSEAHSVVYYSTDKQKCIDWVKEKKTSLLAFHQNMLGALEKAIIKGLETNTEKVEERKE